MATRKVKRTLSLKSMDSWMKELEKLEKKQIPQISLRIADKLADGMMDCDLQTGTYKLPTRLRESGKVAESGIRNDTKEAIFKEFGTGVIGKQIPHIADELKRIGWKYDRNEHGEKGWWYPTTENDPNPHKWIDPNGQLRAWTKGLPAGRNFYDALQRAEELFPDIAIEEFLREVGK